MNAQEIFATLKTLGKPQTAAIYKRQGSGDNVCGVLTSEIAKIKKKIKVDHSLAMELWKTGNAEARILALLIADPAKLSRADADNLVKDGQVRFLHCYLSDLLARTPGAGPPVIHAWWPARLDPVQLAIHRRKVTGSILMTRPVGELGRIDPPIAADDVLYWHADAF